MKTFFFTLMSYFILKTSILSASTTKVEQLFVKHAVLQQKILPSKKITFSQNHSFKTYENIINKELIKGPNFAGKYNMIGIVQESGKILSVILDSETGKIIWQQETCCGTIFRKDSVFFIVNPYTPCIDFPIKNCRLTQKCYVLKNEKVLPVNTCPQN